MTPKQPGIMALSGLGSNAGVGIDPAHSRYRSDGGENGPTQDFREQLVQHLPRLRRFAMSLTRDNDACNDLVQETCLRALAKSELWEAGTRLDSWLFRMAQNLWFDRIRARRRAGEAVDVEEIAELPGDDGRDVMENKLELEAVMRAMARLKPDHQVIIALVCIDGLSYREVAEVLSIPIGTVMSRLNRARIDLDRCLRTDRKALAAGKGEQPLE
jgi:RNA polymerase sigma-70 factor (ECF subfamily)